MVPDHELPPDDGNGGGGGGGGTTVKLPKWVEEWLKNHGVAVSKFKAVIESAMESIDAPVQFRDKVRAFLASNAVNVSADAILAFVTLVYAELRSGKPGYNKDHGGLA